MSGDRSNIQLVGNTTQGQNLGTGEGSVFKQKVLGNVLQFRTLREGANIKIMQDGDDIIISGATGGTGGGDVNSVNTGLGLSGDTTTGDVTIRLDNTAVTPGTYGNATNVAQITVDQQGRITSATNVEITGSGGATTFTGLTDTPANYTGSANCYVRVNAGATALEFVNPPTGAPAGSDGSVQYNDDGGFGGTTMNYDNSTNTFSLVCVGCGASTDTYFHLFNPWAYTAECECWFLKQGFWDGFNFTPSLSIGTSTDGGGRIDTWVCGHHMNMHSQSHMTIYAGGNISMCSDFTNCVVIEGANFAHNTTNLGFFGATPVAKRTVSGNRCGVPALTQLLIQLACIGLIIDSTSA